MTQVPSRDSQFDRIEAKVDQVLDRLTRMEERQNSHAGQLESHSTQLAEHSQRIREVELKHAVVAANAESQGKRLLGRWAAVGAAALVALGAAGTFIGNAVIELWRGGL